MTTAGLSQNRRSWRRYVILLASFMGLFAGLCTVFALVVTVSEAGWNMQEQSPKATARVRCGVDIYVQKPESYWIDCSLGYSVHGEEIVAHVHSRSLTPAPRRVIRKTQHVIRTTVRW